MIKQSPHSQVCPNCGRLIFAKEKRCPHCGITHPGAWWKNIGLTRKLDDPDSVTRSIIYLNIAMFVVSLLFNSRMPVFSMNPFALLAPESRSLLILGATGTAPIDQYGRLWTLLSANYLHGGILHILFNMLALRQLGVLAGREFGAYRMLSIYTMGGMIGFWVSYRAGVIFTIGASAAICALIGAMLYYGKSRGGAYGQAVFRQIGGWAVAIILFGFMVPGINNWGHGGGLFAGAALAHFMGYREKQPDKLAHKILAVICALATVGILLWAVGIGMVYRFGQG